MARPEGETSNSLLDVRVEWNRGTAQCGEVIERQRSRYRLFAQRARDLNGRVWARVHAGRNRCVPDGQIPARLSRRRLCGCGPCMPLGIGIRALVQHRLSTQRHPLRRTDATPCGPGRRAAAVPRRAIPSRPRTPSAAQERPDTQLAIHPCCDALSRRPQGFFSHCKADEFSSIRRQQSGDNWLDARRIRVPQGCDGVYYFAAS